jgi:D-alanyl-D-alanine carboxypeptidase
MPRVSVSFALFLVLSALHAQSLHAEIDALLHVEWLRYGYCGVVVRDLQTGETLYTRDAERVLIPASNMKLLVSAAALHRLGPDYRFRTRVWMRGTLLPDGTLQGDLILQGLGDATLEMRGLETLAQQVRQAGVQRVQGYLLYDDSWLDAERYGFGWSSDDEPFGYQAQMSALCAERNAVRLYAKPATQVGQPAQLRLEPATDYVALVNRTRTGGTRRAEHGRPRDPHPRPQPDYHRGDAPAWRRGGVRRSVRSGEPLALRGAPVSAGVAGGRRGGGAWDCAELMEN